MRLQIVDIRLLACCAGWPCSNPNQPSCGGHRCAEPACHGNAQGYLVKVTCIVFGSVLRFPCYAGVCEDVRGLVCAPLAKVQLFFWLNISDGGFLSVSPIAGADAELDLCFRITKEPARDGMREAHPNSLWGLKPA